jgi:hypothetical protein
MYYCVKCSDDVNPMRWKLNIHLCLVCGEALARTVRHTIVPLAKSNYVAVRDPQMLKQLNKYSNHSV